MIKALIFDLSGVVFNCEEPLFFEYFAQQHHVPVAEVDTTYSDLVVQAERSEISLAELWKKILLHFQIKDTTPRMIQHMTETIIGFRKLNPAMVELLKKLRSNTPQQYKLAYFTNYCKEYWQISEQRWPIAQYFDYGIVSYAIKSRKPDEKGFRLILQHLKVKPEETIFTDDSAKNLVNAQKMGINVIHFKNPEQFKQELVQWGVNTKI